VCNGFLLRGSGILPGEEIVAEGKKGVAKKEEVQDKCMIVDLIHDTIFEWMKIACRRAKRRM
jgi:hypothetical protein